MKIITLYSIFLVLLNCTNSSPIKEQEIKKKESSEKVLHTKEVETKTTAETFVDFHKGFTSLLKEKNIEQINKHIHSDFGIWVIESPGAMPIMRKFYNLNDYQSFSNNQPITDLAINIIKEPLKIETLPKIICEETIYNKEGYFADTTNLISQSQIWNYAGLNDKQIQEIETLSATINYTVINTSNYTYYFSLIDQKWYVTFINLSTPCDA